MIIITVIVIGVVAPSGTNDWYSVDLRLFKHIENNETTHSCFLASTVSIVSATKNCKCQGQGEPTRVSCLSIPSDTHAECPISIHLSTNTNNKVNKTALFYPSFVRSLLIVSLNAMPVLLLRLNFIKSQHILFRVSYYIERSPWKISHGWWS